MRPEQLEQVRGTTVIDPTGEKIGEIEQIYLDQQTRMPEWMLVNTGPLGTKPTIIPLHGASQSGDAIQVPFAKDTVTDAPDIEPGRELSGSQERQLYRHYGFDHIDGDTAV